MLAPQSVKRATAFLVAFLCSISIASQADTKAPSAKKPVSSKIYFALGNKYELPLKEERNYFSCSDKIFTVIELNNLPRTQYDLAIVWKDPSNNERERTEHTFTVARDETRLWSWLSLSPSEGAAMIQWINPAAGLEEFVGPWTVDILINNRKISSKSFEVIC